MHLFHFCFNFILFGHLGHVNFDVQYLQKAVFSFEKRLNCPIKIFNPFVNLLKNLAFLLWIAKKAPTSMFDWVLNTYTPEVDKKDTRTTSFLLLMCFYFWLWTNLVQWFSCIFDIFRKLMFSLFSKSKQHLGKVLKNARNRWHNTLLKRFRKKGFGIKNVLQIAEMIQQ